MKSILIGLMLFLYFGKDASAQNKLEIEASLNVENKSMLVFQKIRYQNTTADTLDVIYLSDWNNSYSTKTTPLAKRFEEEFSTKFHLAKSEERGFTTITQIKNAENQELTYSYLKEHPDVLKVALKKPLLPNQSYNLDLHYILVFPDDTFTSYGVNKNRDFHLKYWYLTPVVYDGHWNYYSNKNLDDLYVPLSDIEIKLTHPRDYRITSELDMVERNVSNGIQTTLLKGYNRTDSFLSLSKLPAFAFIQTDDFILVSDINERLLIPQEKALLTDNITRFLTKNLGPYPHKRLVVTEIEYSKNPLYGLNQLPNFIQPFQNNFQYELKLLKTALKKYIDNILIVNPRKDYWLSEGLQIYFMIKYIEENYPDTKLLGSFSEAWLVKSFHAADLDFNFQYFLYFMEMARKNNDQPLTTSKDSLIKFNANIAGKYKAGLGMNYLEAYLENDNFRSLILEFLETHRLQPTGTEDFESFIKEQSNKDLSWFFEDYVSTRSKIDYKLKSLVKTKDSIKIQVKNKSDNRVPITLYGLKKDRVVSKVWLEGFKGTKTFQISNDSIDRVVLDYEQVLPEFNQRDNYKATSGLFLTRKPLQFRIFKDIEDPYYNQVFIMPLIEYNNIYDGLTLGTKFYNKSILRKRLNYRFSPQYATKSNTLTGSASVFYTHNLENQNLFNLTYGISAAYQSFGQDAFVTSFQPSVSFNFRNDNDFRSDTRDIINLRYVGIERDIGPNSIIELNEPDYGVLNLRYLHSSPGIINYSKFFADYQLAQDFSKISVNYEIRRLTQSNRNVNFRFFAGVFLTNNTDPNSNFFSFALDRPTDYLFDFNYFGRSEDSGFFSQQIIIAEGGFKSQLEPAFANQWMTTMNFSTSIWRYIQAYGDIGLVKNRYDSAKFMYDSGIRIVLIEDYFEVYFPVYSNRGWEIGQSNYDQRIRFMFTLDPQVLLSLFTRKWY